MHPVLSPLHASLKILAESAVSVAAMEWVSRRSRVKSRLIPIGLASGWLRARAMTILFPAHPLIPREPDPDYAEEWTAAGASGFGRMLFNLDRLRAVNGDAALATLPSSEPLDPHILYRGWMLTDIQQKSLCDALLRCGYTPVVGPEAYQEAHYLPNAYDKFEAYTARSAWMRGHVPEAAWCLYQGFRSEDALIKDFVKSAKHRWKEACFIPAGTDQSEFNQILAAFLDARGEQFNHGIVLRRYHPLTILGTDLRGFPIAEENRMFFWRGTDRKSVV
jgi:hypothetical protein